MDTPRVSRQTILARWVMRIFVIGLVIWSVGGYLSIRAAEFGVFDPRRLRALGSARHTWRAIDLPATGQLVSEADRQFVRGTTDQPGFFLYGPGIPILAGRYQLTITGRTNASGPVGVVQVAGEGGTRVIWSGELSYVTFAAPILLELPSLLDLEVRFSATTDVAVDIEAMTLTRTEIAWWPTIRELPKHIVTIWQSVARRSQT